MYRLILVHYSSAIFHLQKCLTNINQYIYTIANTSSYWLRFFMTEISAFTDINQE